MLSETWFVEGGHAPAQAFHQMAPGHNVHPFRPTRQGLRVFLHQGKGISLANPELKKACGSVSPPGFPPTPQSRSLLKHGGCGVEAQ